MLLVTPTMVQAIVARILDVRPTQVHIPSPLALKALLSWTLFKSSGIKRGKACNKHLRFVGFYTSTHGYLQDDTLYEANKGLRLTVHGNQQYQIGLPDYQATEPTTVAQGMLRLFSRVEATSDACLVLELSSNTKTTRWLLPVAEALEAITLSLHSQLQLVA